jgi:hypothetical protein
MKGVRIITSGSLRAPLRCVAAALVAATGILGLASSCSRSTEPPVQVHPLLSAVNVDDFTSSFVDGGLVAVSGLPTDTSYRPGARDRIPVDIMSSSGDTESVELSPYACGEPPTVYACHELSLEMNSGYRAQQLRQVMDGIPARFILVSVTGQSAGIWVFDPASLDDAIRLLARQPGVRYVGRALLGGGGGSSGGSGVSPTLAGALPLDFTRVVPRDGHLQARSGVTLTVTYNEPNGMRLVSQFLIP